MRLAIEAITAASADAGIRPKDVDGYSSYYSSVEPAELVTAFGAERLRYASQTWGGGRVDVRCVPERGDGRRH